MLTPALLDLYNSAVASLPSDRKEKEAQVAESISKHYEKASRRLTGLVNALERKDAAAVKALLETTDYQHFAPTFAEQAFLYAAEGLTKPPEAFCARVVSNAPGFNATITMPVGDAAPIAALEATTADLPPSEPPASAPQPAAAEPTPEPGPTAPGPNARKKKR